jgi:hypothetical protein
MRFFCPYAPGQLRPETKLALDTHAGSVEYVEMNPNSPHFYPQTLARFWTDGESFCVIEQDIVIRKDVIDAVLECDCDYGCFPYAWATAIGPALGCTWFRSAFLARHPLAMNMVLRTGVTWSQLDVVLMRRVLARKLGEQPHVHLPPVEHLNEAKRLLPGADPTPLLSVPTMDFGALR